MSTLTLRIITAVVLAGGFLSLLFLAPVAYSAAFLAMALLIAINEWAGFAGWQLGFASIIYTLAAAGLMALIWQMSAAEQSLPLALVISGISWLLALFALIFWTGRLAKPLVVVAGWLFLLPAWLMAERLVLAGTDGPVLLFLLFWIVAAADIGAYFSGKTFGKHKLLPRVSPGKTIEGLVGGVLSAGLAASLGVALLGWTVPQAVLLGLAVAAVSVVGDLTVSLFKRNAGLKDSGKILPGHGGILDRIDGVIAALPMYVALLVIFGKLPALSVI
jgi:phosphatidate cytidylyltransferase